MCIWFTACVSLAAKCCAHAVVVCAGYGGHGTSDAQAAAQIAAAAQRQEECDINMAQQLSAICSYIQGRAPVGHSNGTEDFTDLTVVQASSSSCTAATSAVGILHNIPISLCAVLLAGPLPYLLRLLFRNDSLLDISARKHLYEDVMRLMRSVLTLMWLTQGFL